MFSSMIDLCFDISILCGCSLLKLGYILSSVDLDNGFVY